jgi:CRP-like cAMP-binding protein
MSTGKHPDEGNQGDILERMHVRGRRRDERVPDFDIEKTLRLVRAIRDLAAREGDPAIFWAALTTTAQGDLVSAAQKQVFAAGTALMREGERAGSVMVILDGRTKVCVEENGRERVVAERGPGDIIGESGVAPGGVRSATVTATEEVLALVVMTEHFAALAGKHPDLPDLVKQHSYDRVTDPHLPSG